MEPGPHDQPPAASPMGVPPMLSQETRTWGLLCHLSGLVMVMGIPSVVGPLIAWLVGREKDPFIDDQGKEAVNFHIAFLIAFAVAMFAYIVLSFVTLGIGFLFLWILPVTVGVYGFVMTILGAIKANQGEWYRYPITYRFLK